MQPKRCIQYPIENKLPNGVKVSGLFFTYLSKMKSEKKDITSVHVCSKGPQNKSIRQKKELNQEINSLLLTYEGL